MENLNEKRGYFGDFIKRMCVRVRVSLVQLFEKVHNEKAECLANTYKSGFLRGK